MSVIYLIVALLVPIIPLLAARRLSIAPGGGLMILVSLCLFLGVPMKVIYTYFVAGTLSEPWFQRPDYAVEFALVYILLFSVMIALGYILAVRPGERYEALAVLERQTIRPGAALALIVGCAGAFILVLMLLQSRRSGFDDLSTLLTLEGVATANRQKIDAISRTANFGNTHSFVFALLGICWLSVVMLSFSVLSRGRERIHVAALGIILCLVTAEVLLRGTRVQIVNIVFYVLFAMFLVKGRLDWRVVSAVALGLPVLAGLFVAMSVFRHFGADTQGIAAGDAAFIAFWHIFASTYFTDINNLASVMWRMEDREFLMGQSFTNIFIALIPREIWPDKPAVSLGIFVRSELYGIERSISAYNTPMPVEAYINFGWGGVLVGFVYGWCLRRFEAWCLAARRVARSGTAWLYVFAGIPLSWNMMQTGTTLAFTAAILATIFWLAAGLPLARLGLAGPALGTGPILPATDRDVDGQPGTATTGRPRAEGPNDAFPSPAE